MSLNVSVGGCQYNFSYGYYSAPLVRRVHPECGPRYGSFPLTVYLEDSLDIVSRGKVLVPFCSPARLQLFRALHKIDHLHGLPVLSMTHS